MFGLVKIAESELLVKEWRHYKSYYCGLCRQIAQYSQISRFMLSYDMVFIALLIGTSTSLDKQYCKKRIFKSCKKIQGDNRLEYIAAVSIILQYQKLRNDIVDGNRIKKLALYMISRGYKKAACKFDKINNKINDAMNALYKLEKQQCADYKKLQECFAGMFIDVINNAPTDDEYIDIKKKIIYCVASWVYFFDMLIDMEDDKNTGDFNAILIKGGKECDINEVYEILIKNINEAEKLVNLLPHSKETTIIKNIISSGLPLQMYKKQCVQTTSQPHIKKWYEKRVLEPLENTTPSSSLYSGICGPWMLVEGCCCEALCGDACCGNQYNNYDVDNPCEIVGDSCTAIPIIFDLIVCTAIGVPIINRINRNRRRERQQTESINRRVAETRRNRPTLPDGMGAIYEWPGGTNAIGYFRDGIVYTRNQIAIGSYEANNNRYDFIYDDLTIGYYYNGDIYLWDDSPGGTRRVARHHGEQEYIHTEDRNFAELQTVIFEGDPVGAAAAFVVLFYGYGAWDMETFRRFLR